MVKYYSTFFGVNLHLTSGNSPVFQLFQFKSVCLKGTQKAKFQDSSWVLK